MLQRPKTIPTESGVYIFWRKKTPLYVGKTAILKNRVSSYFKKNSGWKVEGLRKEATKLEFIKTPSDIEALIKEAELIKKYVPKYNILMRDDKSYTYIGVTRGQFPRFYFTHQPTRLPKVKQRSQRSTELPDTFIGPFVESSLLKDSLRLLRRVFPYCSCKEKHKRDCLNAQIGRCFGFCCRKDRIATLDEISRYQKKYSLNYFNFIRQATHLDARSKKEYARSVKKSSIRARGNTA